MLLGNPIKINMFTLNREIDETLKSMSIYKSPGNDFR